MIKNKFKNSISLKLLKVVLTIYVIITIIMTMVHVVVEYKNTKDSIRSEIMDLEKTFKQPLAKAIWNFAPVRILVRENVVVKHENLASSFLVLAKRFIVSNKQ